MIILDTNVVSAIMRVEREPAVRDWLDRQTADELFITTVTVFEVRFGLERLPAGRRRSLLDERFENLVTDNFRGRIIALDLLGAHSAARVHAIRGKSRANNDAPDSLIAGLAVHFGSRIATRDKTAYSGLDIALIDPWTD